MIYVFIKGEFVQLPEVKVVKFDIDFKKHYSLFSGHSNKATEKVLKANDIEIKHFPQDWKSCYTTQPIYDLSNINNLL